MKSCKQVRYERLQALVAAHDHGSRDAFRKRMGWESATLANAYLNPNPERRRGIGDAQARDIERRYRVEENFLDNDPASGVWLSPMESEFLAILRVLSPRAQSTALGEITKLLVEEKGHRAGATLSPARAAGQGVDFSAPTPYEDQHSERPHTGPQGTRKRTSIKSGKS